MNATILGWGTALPPHVLEQETALDWMLSLCPDMRPHRRQLELLYRRSGVRRRHTVLDLPGPDLLRPGAPGERGPSTAARLRRYDAEAPPLAVAAARAALDDADLLPDAVTHLVTVSCTGAGAPGVDVALIKALELAPETPRSHVGFMGCHGAFNGLAVADALTARHSHAVVLLCAVELCSLHLQYDWDEQAAVAHALFGDGAAAVLLSRAAGVRGVGAESGTESGTGSGAAPGPGAGAGAGTGPSWSLAATGSLLLPDGEADMSWRIEDHGFRMGLSPRVPDRIGRSLRPWLEAWLDAQGTSLDRIASWAVHPGGPRVLTSVATALDLPPGALATSRERLAICGNMSSPTVLFILDDERRRSASCPTVALAFGPGLAIEAALFV